MTSWRVQLLTTEARNGVVVNLIGLLGTQVVGHDVDHNKLAGQMGRQHNVQWMDDERDWVRNPNEALQDMCIGVAAMAGVGFASGEDALHVGQVYAEHNLATCEYIFNFEIFYMPLTSLDAMRATTVVPYASMGKSWAMGAAAPVS